MNDPRLHRCTPTAPGPVLPRPAGIPAVGRSTGASTIDEVNPIAVRKLRCNWRIRRAALMPDAARAQTTRVLEPARNADGSCHGRPVRAATRSESCPPPAWAPRSRPLHLSSLSQRLAFRQRLGRARPPSFLFPPASPRGRLPRGLASAPGAERARPRPPEGNDGTTDGVETPKRAQSHKRDQAPDGWVNRRFQ